ncbi:MAG: ATP-binding protein [Opitutaceae bacterium]|jgi:PAS domain S-box-containing protein
MTTTAPHLPPVFSRMEPAILERVLSKALERSPMLIVLFDPATTQLLFMNGQAQQVLNPGRRIDWSLAAYSLSDFIGPSSRDSFDSEVRSHLSVLGRWQGGLDLLDACGSEVSLFATLSMVSLGPGTRYICLQALQPDALRDNRKAKASDQDFLNALLNHLPDWVYFKDKAGRYLRASKSLATHVGHDDPRALIGHTDFDFFSVDHAASVHTDEQTILATRRPMIAHEENETLPDGRVVWVSTTKLPLHDTGGELLGTFGVSRDITARKNTERERRELELRLQLAHKLESIGMLAAGVAHEINTPTQFIADNTRFLKGAFARFADAIGRYRALAAVNPGMAQEASRIEADNELAYHLGEIPRTLDQTLDGLGRVVRIVGSLKEFSHPNTLERLPADLNRAIETTLAVARHEWKYVADVVTEFDPALPPVPCILDEFNQVVLNLVINACHAIEETLKSSGAGKGLITIRTRRDAASAWIEISDTGAGIPAEIHDRIFELFFTTKRADKGTGQGLALVRNIVVQHHAGSVDFTSEVGRGTTFRVQLPLVAPADASPFPASRSAHEQKNPLR